MTGDKNDSQSSRVAQDWPIRTRSTHRARQRCFYPDPLFPSRSRSCMGTAAPIRFIGFRVRAAPCVFPSLPGEETRQARPHPSSVYAERRVI